MITSFIGILELPDFGHRNKSIKEFELHYKILLVTSWRNYDVIVTYILRKPGVFSFADIKKIAIILMKTTLKDSIKVKIIRN